MWLKPQIQLAFLYLLLLIGNKSILATLPELLIASEILLLILISLSISLHGWSRHIKFSHLNILTEIFVVIIMIPRNTQFPALPFRLLVLLGGWPPPGNLIYSQLYWCLLFDNSVWNLGFILGLASGTGFPLWNPGLSLASTLDFILWILSQLNGKLYFLNFAPRSIQHYCGIALNLLHRYNSYSYYFQLQLLTMHFLGNIKSFLTGNFTRKKKKSRITSSLSLRRSDASTAIGLTLTPLLILLVPNITVTIWRWNPQLCPLVFDNPDKIRRQNNQPQSLPVSTRNQINFVSPDLHLQYFNFHNFCQRPSPSTTNHWPWESWHCALVKISSLYLDHCQLLIFLIKISLIFIPLSFTKILILAYTYRVPIMGLIRLSRLVHSLNYFPLQFVQPCAYFYDYWHLVCKCHCTKLFNQHAFSPQTSSSISYSSATLGSSTQAANVSKEYEMSEKC
jgi:hypothetical protein